MPIINEDTPILSIRMVNIIFGLFHQRADALKTICESVSQMTPSAIDADMKELMSCLKSNKFTCSYIDKTRDSEIKELLQLLRQAMLKQS